VASDDEGVRRCDRQCLIGWGYAARYSSWRLQRFEGRPHPPHPAVGILVGPAGARQCCRSVGRAYEAVGHVVGGDGRSHRLTPSAQADRRAQRCGGCRRVPGFRSGVVDHRRRVARGRWRYGSESGSWDVIAGSNPGRPASIHSSSADSLPMSRSLSDAMANRKFRNSQ
jgi:hypothetical protein